MTIRSNSDLLALALLVFAGRAMHGSELPFCSNFRVYYCLNTPLGAECTGSWLWVKRHLTFSSQIGPVI